MEEGCRRGCSYDKRSTDNLGPAETFAEDEDGAAGCQHGDQVEDQPCVRDGEIADREVEGEKGTAPPSRPVATAARM